MREHIGEHGRLDLLYLVELILELNVFLLLLFIKHHCLLVLYSHSRLENQKIGYLLVKNDFLFLHVLEVFLEALELGLLL